MTVGDNAPGLKKLQELKKGLSEIELESRALELRTALHIAQEEVFDIKTKLEAANSKIADLERKFSFAKALVEHHGYMFEARDDKPVGHPYCPACITKHNLYHRLVNPSQKEKNLRGDKKCSGCGMVYGNPVPTFDYP